jgi:hypothetical protein
VKYITNFAKNILRVLFLLLLLGVSFICIKLYTVNVVISNSGSIGSISRLNNILFTTMNVDYNQLNSNIYKLFNDSPLILGSVISPLSVFSSSLVNTNTTNSVNPSTQAIKINNSFISNSKRQPEINKKWGVSLGWEVKDLIMFEKMVHNTPKYVGVFVPWGEPADFPLELAKYAKNNNITLVVYWDAWDYTNLSITNTTYGYDSIINGKWDTYLSDFAKIIKDSETKIIIIPFEEANGNWYPWSGTLNNNSPFKEIEAYRYLHKYFINIPNVKMGWAINNVSVPDNYDNSLIKYYPGDKYVDYIGVDGFNFGDSWTSFNDLFSEFFTIFEPHNKPLFIFSAASAPGPKKAQWIKDMKKQLNKHPLLAGWIWFNENKEYDWRVNSDTKSLNAFRKIIR